MPTQDGPTIAVPSTIDQCNTCVGLSGCQCTHLCLEKCDCNPFLDPCSKCDGLATPDVPIPDAPTTTCPSTCQTCQNKCNQCVHGQCTEFCIENCNCDFDPCEKCVGLSGLVGPTKCTDFCMEKCDCNPGAFWEILELDCLMLSRRDVYILFYAFHVLFQKTLQITFGPLQICTLDIFDSLIIFCR